MNPHLSALLKVAGLTAVMAFLGAFSADTMPTTLVGLMAVLKPAVWSAIVAERVMLIAQGTPALQSLLSPPPPAPVAK